MEEEQEIKQEVGNTTEKESEDKTPRNRLLPIGLIIGLVAIVGGYLLIRDRTTNQAVDIQGVATQDTSMEESQDVESEMTTSYTLDEVSKHATEEDCWLAIEGKVYDVTEFIASENHPGGKAIIEGCGTDATELYNTRPMGSNTPHSDRARSLLPNFEIGTLQE